jgi:ATP-dependent DNA helicase RecG
MDDSQGKRDEDKIESQTTEWKREWKDEYLDWICGFANSQGGRLFLGIDDKGRVYGLNNRAKLLKDIPNQIRQAMGIVPEVNLHSDGAGEEYLEIVVSPYPVPISVKGKYFVRSGATNQLLNGLDLDRFMQRKSGLCWESMPIPSLQMSDLDDSIIDTFLKKAISKGRIAREALSDSKEDLIRRLRLGNGVHLTNAAALLFGKELSYFFTGAYIKIGFFITDAEIIYQDEISGPLLRQIDQTVDTLCLKYLKAKISYQGIQRIESYPYPLEALREAILNALIHKDYSSGIPIQISVYDDKLYVGNVGRLPADWSLEVLLGKHVSIPFNPTIARIFYLSGYVESWGRGVEKIFTACRNDGVPEPEYTVHPRDIMLKFKAHPDRIIPSGHTVVRDKFTDTTDILTDISKNLTDSLTDKELAVLKLVIENNCYTTSEMAAILAVSRQTITSRLKALQEKKLISRIGSDRKGRWEIIKKLK